MTERIAIDGVFYDKEDLRGYIAIVKTLDKRIEEIEQWALTGHGVYSDYVLPELKKIKAMKI